jgi:polysaccharide biosynthesis/export protein
MTAMGGGGATVGGGGEPMTGYFVDQEGFIDFPILGRFDVKQKTLNEVKSLLYNKLKTYLKDPVVNIRFLNLKISVLGEVARPGTIRLTNKRVTIFEAIGLAGDMTPYSNRTNILLIREQNGRRFIKRINLQSSKVFTSPYYYLQQNDVVIVDPNKTKANTTADPASRWITYVSAGVSILTVFAILFRQP